MLGEGQLVCSVKTSEEEVRQKARNAQKCTLRGVQSERRCSRSPRGDVAAAVSGGRRQQGGAVDPSRMRAGRRAYENSFTCSRYAGNVFSKRHVACHLPEPFRHLHNQPPCLFSPLTAFLPRFPAPLLSQILCQGFLPQERVA